MATNESEEHESNLKDFSNAAAEENRNISDSAECTPLLGNERQGFFMTLQQKFCCRCHRCCLTSKAAILILVWNLFLVVGLRSFFGPHFYDELFGDLYPTRNSITILSGSVYSVIAFLFLFYPLAGCLADIRWGRYRTVVYSL